MKLLVQYDRAMSAIAVALESTAIDVVLGSRDELEAVKANARRVLDRELLLDAMEYQLRVERHLGRLLILAREAGHLRETQGRPKKAQDGEMLPATLKDIGVDKKLSVRAQALAAKNDDEFEAVIGAMREKAAAGNANVINGARALMGSRIEDADSLDYFPTPPWATRALLEHVFPVLRIDPQRYSASEPACGEGHIAEVLEEYFAEVFATDIFDHGYGVVRDYLDEGAEVDAADFTITNPPFADKSEAFLLRALEHSRKGVALFVRMQWLESEGRYERIFSTRPPTLVAFFAERVNLCKGRWNPEGGTATAYIWLVWVNGAKPRAPFWIPPGCRDTLTRPDDVERFTQHPVAKRNEAS